MGARAHQYGECVLCGKRRRTVIVAAREVVPHSDPDTTVCQGAQVCLGCLWREVVVEHPDPWKAFQDAEGARTREALRAAAKVQGAT